MNFAPRPAPAPNQTTEQSSGEEKHTVRAGRHAGPKKDGIRSPRAERSSRPGRASRNIRRALRRPTPLQSAPKKNGEYYPEPAGENVVRVLPLGGVEEVGRNMYIVEANGDIFVLDAGFQFVSEDTAPGIEYMLPNTKYLEKNQERIRAVIISHGHLDHIGGIPFVLPRFGNPPIYTCNLTAVMIAKRYEEFPDVPRPEIITVERSSVHTIGNSRVEFFPVTHSIPDSMGVSIQTKYGNVVVTGDLKLDHESGEPSEGEKAVWSHIGSQNNLFFVADSTNAERDGFSMPEKRVHANLGDIVKTVQGRLIIGTLSSQLERMVHIIKTAEALGKKIVTEGRSIRTNIEIAQKVGLLNVDSNTIISAQEMQDYSPDRIIILCTGAQGEEYGALMRIATGQHKYIAFSERDTIILSSSVIPGNELAVQRLKDNLYRRGVTLIHYRSSDVHSTGHGNAGELVWFNQQVNAKFFMPAYGYYSMTSSHARAVAQAGRPRESIVVADNGMVIDVIDGTTLQIHKEKVPSAPLLVDGFSIGDMQEVVIRDRQMLAKDGFFNVFVLVNGRTGKVRKSPDILSRAFVYIRDSQELFNEARILIKKTVEETTDGMNPIDYDYVKNVLTDALAGFLYQKTNKAPLILINITSL